MPRIQFTLAYDGTHYAGWQLQAHKNPPKNHPPTIQGELEKVFARIAGERIVVHGAGRTDSGVHAEAQVFHVDVPPERAGFDWLRALNATLPLDIRILQQTLVASDFHARKSALKKRYAYTVWSAPIRALPRLHPYVWSTPPLDSKRMRQSAALLVGRQDFASLQNSGSEVEDTVRTLFSITPVPALAGQLLCPTGWPVTTWIVEGDGFLRQMVRNIMGLLVWAGQGKIDPEAIPAMLAAKERKAVISPTAPPQGLTLLDITY